MAALKASTGVLHWLSRLGISSHAWARRAMKPSNSRFQRLTPLSAWCPDRRTDLRLHFAKTGTSVGSDINATVDTWIAGGLQFSNGAAYSYVVLIGTGSPAQSWARSLHAAQVGVPLLDTLLADHKDHARKHGVPVAAQAKPVAAAVPAGGKAMPSWRERVFQTN